MLKCCIILMMDMFVFLKCFTLLLNTKSIFMLIRMSHRIFEARGRKSKDSHDSAEGEYEITRRCSSAHILKFLSINPHSRNAFQLIPKKNNKRRELSSEKRVNQLVHRTIPSIIIIGDGVLSLQQH